MKFIIIFLIIVGIGAGAFFVFISGAKEENSPASQENVSTGGTLINKIETPTPESKDEGSAKDKAPPFTLKDYEGKEVSLSDFVGQNVIVNSWAVWCPFCVEELKDFAALERELGEDITIIAIDRKESLEKQKRYTDDLGVTNDIVFLLDPDDSFYRSIGGFSMPETLFVDANGSILLHKRGPMKLEEMKQKVNQLFNI